MEGKIYSSYCAPPLAPYCTEPPWRSATNRARERGLVCSFAGLSRCPGSTFAAPACVCVPFVSVPFLAANKFTGLGDKNRLPGPSVPHHTTLCQLAGCLRGECVCVCVHSSPVLSGVGRIGGEQKNERGERACNLLCLHSLSAVVHR